MDISCRLPGWPLLGTHCSEGLVTEKLLFKTVIAENCFRFKMHEKRWVAESLAAMAVAASRPGKGKSPPRFASPLVSTTNPTLNNVNCARKLIHHCVVTTFEFPYFDYNYCLQLSFVYATVFMLHKLRETVKKTSLE